MRFCSRVAWSAVVSIAAGSAVFAASPLRTVVDATGAKVNVAATPERVLALAPSLAELAADLASADGTDFSRIVGITDYCDFPPPLSKKPSVGAYSRFSVEKAAALKPDLALATLDGNAQDQIAQLRDLGVPVVVVATSTLKQVEDSMRLVAEALGSPERGKRMAQELAKGVAHVRASVPVTANRPKVVIQVGDEPLVVAGGHTFLSEALGAVDAENAYPGGANHYPRPSVEDVLQRNPDVILVLALGRDLKPYERMAARWREFPALNAVKKGRIKVLQADTLLRPTLRLLEGLSLLKRAIHD